MDDAAARLPESDAVLGRHRAQEIVDLTVRVVRHRQIFVGPYVGLDQVVAVHRRRHRDLGQARGHELQQGHLGRGVLHRDAVGVELRVRLAPIEPARLGVGQVVDQDLLGEREGPTQPTPTDRHTAGQLGVDLLDQFERGVGGDGHGTDLLGGTFGLVDRRQV